jgi:hypothetical protein
VVPTAYGYALDVRRPVTSRAIEVLPNGLTALWIDPSAGREIIS